MPYVKDPRVDAYLDGLPTWQRDLCRQVRALVHAADPDVEETVKRRVQPYFVLDGNICALLATRDTSTSSSTTVPSFPIPRGSSRRVTRTRPPGPSRSAGMRGSTSGP